MQKRILFTFLTLVLVNSSSKEYIIEYHTLDGIIPESQVTAHAKELTEHTADPKIHADYIAEDKQDAPNHDQKKEEAIYKCLQALLACSPKITEGEGCLQFEFPFSIEELVLIEKAYEDGSCGLLLIDPLTFDPYATLVGRIFFDRYTCYYEPHRVNPYRIWISKNYKFDKFLTEINFTESKIEGNTLTIPCIFEEAVQ